MQDMKQQEGDGVSLSYTCSFLLLLLVELGHWLLEKPEGPMGIHKSSRHSSMGSE